jgi:hypothetical protein
MGMMDRMRRWLGHGDKSPNPCHAPLGVEELQRLGLVSLAEVAGSTGPFVERRREQHVGPQEGPIVMRRRASDWAPASDAATKDQQQERRAG